MFQTMVMNFDERKLEEMMQCRDIMEEQNYRIEMTRGITDEIDEIITEGMQNRK